MEAGLEEAQTVVWETGLATPPAPFLVLPSWTDNRQTDEAVPGGGFIGSIAFWVRRSCALTLAHIHISVHAHTHIGTPGLAPASSGPCAGELLACFSFLVLGAMGCGDSHPSLRRRALSGAVRG